MIALLLVGLLLTTAPAAAAEERRPLVTDLERLAGELLDKATAEKMLRGLVDQALATIQDHFEVEGAMPSEGTGPTGNFRMKLFPLGKSRSQEHVTAEGSFDLSPDAEQQLNLRFKSSKPPLRSTPPAGEIL
jgi:hypothetical protein